MRRAVTLCSLHVGQLGWRYESAPHTGAGRVGRMAKQDERENQTISSNSRANEVKMRGPFAVMSTSSSILTPPHSAI